MKLAAAILATLYLVGCSAEDRAKGLPTSPTQTSAPPVTSPTTGGIWGMVLEESGACIVGATVEVIDGERRGEIQVQRTPCGYWDYDGGFVFDNLHMGTQITLRASASGYTSKDFTVAAVSSGPYVDVTLSKRP